MGRSPPIPFTRDENIAEKLNARGGQEGAHYHAPRNPWSVRERGRFIRNRLLFLRRYVVPVLVLNVANQRSRSI